MPIQAAIDALIAKYKTLIADASGFKFLGLIYEAVKQIVAAVELLPENGAGKKAAALAFLEQLIDTVVTPTNLVPDTGLTFIDGPIEAATDATVKATLLRAADGLIEAAVLFFNANGWPQE